MKYKCPCCGYYTLEERAGEGYGVCEVCFWEDDIVQLEDPNFEGGANRPSLIEARKNFKEFGASEWEMVPYVREPFPDELFGFE